MEENGPMMTASILAYLSGMTAVLLFLHGARLLDDNVAEHLSDPAVDTLPTGVGIA